MDATVTVDDVEKPTWRSKRFATLDFARGLAIFLMIVLHTIQFVLNVPDLFVNLDNLPLINMVALIIIPFYGGIAGFFLLISSSSNMVSMCRDLEKGNSIKGVVLKQIMGGVLLLFFAMLSEAVIGYNGAFGNFFKYYLNNPGGYFQYDQQLNFEHWTDFSYMYNWQTILYRWNHFETIHTIAWSLIINGCVQGLLSLKKNWQNRKQIILTYALLAVAVVALTLPIWELVKVIVPGYPFGIIPKTGNVSFVPVIGEDSWWRILSAPFLSVLAAPMEPLFPYLAISFIGSIIGIVISKPKEEINKNFPRNMFLVGLTMFIAGMIGVVVIIVNILTVADFETAVQIYEFIAYHRHWTPDYMGIIPLFAWLAQFLTVNGYSLMLVMILFRIVEFRGISKKFSDRTRFIRRFGTVAFTNYNNQWIFYIVFFFSSWAIFFTPYAKFYWAGTFLVIFITLIVFYLLLIVWEKLKYVGSLEWMIRTIANNIVPARRKRFDPSVKWWRRGHIDVEGTFYNPEWIDFVDPEEEKAKNEEQYLLEERDSKFALILSIVGLASLIFNAMSIFGLFVSLRARRMEGINKRNTAALIISIIGCVFFVAFYVVCSIVKIGVLGIF
ncbi:MAG: hypothetical protein ACTSO7_11735 [Candidatus Heimdallarchaeota archaeon]